MTTNNWESHCMELKRELAELRGKVQELEKPKMSNKGRLTRAVNEEFPCIMVQTDNLVDLVKDFKVEVAVSMRGEDLKINIYNRDDSVLSVAIGDIVYFKNGVVHKYLESDGFFSIFEKEAEAQKPKAAVEQEQLEEFGELLKDYLLTVHVSRMLDYDKGEVQAAMDKLVAFVRDLIACEPKWKPGVPDHSEYVTVCFKHSDGEYYHDSDQWNPETKEWKRHNDKNILGWFGIPKWVSEIEGEK